MAIRISKGASIPQAGRITMPKGTYLSSPSTVADGSLGGSSGMNPAAPQVSMWGSVTPGYNTVQTPFAGMIDPNPFAQHEYRPPTQPVQLWNPIAPDKFGPLAGVVKFGQDMIKLGEAAGRPATPTPSFAQSAQTAQQYAQMPTMTQYGAVIPMNIANQSGAADGLSPAQVASQMQSAGYTQKWVEDLGQVWVKGEGGPVAGSPGAGGRPEWVDGASLAPGESVTDANGNRFVGGTPAPDGTAQYAVNYANPAAAKDTKGKYKWVSNVKKDANGNWVRVNRQVLRKVYTRSHLKKQAAQNEAAAQQEQQAQMQPGEFNQLVNFRAGFG